MTSEHLKETKDSTKETPSTYDLALDTTTDIISAALRPYGMPHSSSKIYKQESLGFDRAALLIAWLQEILQEAGMTAQNISRIIIPRGPGSFTGIRLGIAVAQGLALACNTQPIGVNILQFLAHRVRTSLSCPDLFLILVPLVRDQAIGQWFNKDPSMLPKEPEVLSTEQLQSLNAQSISLFWDRFIPPLMPRQGTVLSWDTHDLLLYGIQTEREEMHMTPLYVRIPSITVPSSIKHVV